MTDVDPSDFRTVGRSPSPMFSILEATDEDVVAIRVHGGSVDGYRALYELLVAMTDEYGSVHVYEEAPGWTVSTYLSHVRGLVPDLRYGPRFDIDRYAAVGDSVWAKALYYKWKAVAPVFPVSPNEMRYYEFTERDAALEWVTTGADRAVRSGE